VEIRRFRGLQELDLEKLGRLNIVLGPNDVGKTSVFEAIFLLTGIKNLQLPLTVQSQRNLPKTKSDDLRLLFHGLDPDQPIDLAGHSLGVTACHRLSFSARHEEIEISADPLARANGGEDISQTGTPRPGSGPGKFRRWFRSTSLQRD